MFLMQIGQKAVLDGQEQQKEQQNSFSRGAKVETDVRGPDGRLSKGFIGIDLAYPNPNQGEFKTDLKLPAFNPCLHCPEQKAIVKIEVYNSIGQEMRGIKIDGKPLDDLEYDLSHGVCNENGCGVGEKIEKIDIDLGDVTSGAYYMRVSIEHQAKDPLTGEWNKVDLDPAMFGEVNNGVGFSTWNISVVK